MLSVYTLEDSEKWDTIVRSFHEHDIYWLSGYVRTFQVHGDGDPLLFFYDDGATRGINVAMLRDIAKAAPFRAYLEEGRCFDLATPYGYGGWLIEGENTGRLFRSYSEWLEKNGIISEFVRFHPLVKNHETCRGFYEIDRLGEVVHMDLSSPEVIWKNLTSENRNRIRKAIKNNVRVRHGSSSEIYEEFRRIYNATMDRNGAEKYYYFDRPFYEAVRKGLARNARIFWAEKDGGVVAASMMIFANGYLNFHLSGSLEEYNTLAPNNLILYEAAIWGCENGYKTFLLGGGLGSKDDTLLRYKKTFHRGDRNHFFIGKKIIRPDLYKELVDMSGLNESPFFPQYRAFSET